MGFCQYSLVWYIVYTWDMCVCARVFSSELDSFRSFEHTHPELFYRWHDIMFEYAQGDPIELQLQHAVFYRNTNYNSP